MNLGIVGGGQLGRMLALAAIPLGIRCRVLDPSPQCPASAVAEQVTGEYEDFAALADFVHGLDAVTYEFENVPVATAEWLAERLPVYPPPAALRVAQDRLVEKDFFRDLGAPTPRYHSVDTRADLDAAIGAVGLPAVLKTRQFGYDGKGQARIRTAADVAPVWDRLGGRPLILEQWVRFDRELSLLAVRATSGDVASYPLIENEHAEGILRRSFAPASDVGALHLLAEAVVRRAFDAVNYVGVLAVEFFQVGGELWVNEMAPRVHNSGHWTIEGASTSQFANHLRAVAGLPLGDARGLCPAAMVNLIGGVPPAEKLLAVPGTHLHVYGKSDRPNRKVGHVTVLAPNEGELRKRVAAIAAICE